MLVLGVSAAVCIVGLIMFILANTPPTPNATVRRIGEVMFACGLLVFLFRVGSAHAINL